VSAAPRPAVLNASAALLNPVFTRVVNHCVTVWDCRATCFARY
jgi:hypothetical protein